MADDLKIYTILSQNKSVTALVTTILKDFLLNNSERIEQCKKLVENIK
jgi:hypothetical protein